jgi:2-dehydro-3-deoxyglucarate aldolase
MNRLNALRDLRARLSTGGHTVGSWMQIPHPSIAEIMGGAGYDWVAADLEHGAIATHQLPDLFRALELGGTLPFARVAEGKAKDVKLALDAGAAGIIVPMVESAEQLRGVISACRWPPAGTRGVGFSRANLFGKRFEAYREEAQAPFIVAQIEHVRAVEDLDAIATVPGLDALLIGPYDLSASMNLTAQFDDAKFLAALARIKEIAARHRVPAGVHIVAPDATALDARIAEGFRFIAYAIDAVFLNTAAARPGVR